MARIAFVLPDLGGGGAERVAVTLVNEIVERGHEVDLVLMQRKGELLDLVRPEVRIVDLATPRVRNVLRPLIRYLRERNPDAVQASMWPLTLMAIIAARLSNVQLRVVVSDHVTLSRQYERPLKRFFLSLTTRLFYPLAQARVCVSHGSVRDLSRLSGLPEPSFTVIYNPVPAPDPAPAEAESWWGTAKTRLLSVGKLKRQKNHKLLLESLALLPENLDAKLLILGDGEMRPGLERLVRDLRLDGRVELLGFIADPAPFYAAADLFVLSSDYEGFALVLVEALHAGLKIVSTDCPDGPAEILEHGRHGGLAAVDDAPGLAAAIVTELARDRDPAAQRARAADFSVDRAADAYLSVLLGLPMRRREERGEAIAELKAQDRVQSGRHHRRSADH
jgi:glycosyltransferase involved in cell wall biosynthesis